MRNTRLVLTASLFLLTTAPAFAHGSFGTLGPFWSGALHIFVSPLAIANLVGFGAALAAIDHQKAGRCLLVATAAAVIGTLMGSGGRWLGPFGAIALGSAAALGLRPSQRLGLALGAAAGLCTALAADVDTPGPVSSLGVALVMFIGGTLPLAGFQELEARLPLARRIVGAWVAAIGLLLGALALKA